MSARGPVPKRSDQRRRQNAPAFGLDKVDGAAAVAPELGFDVHPLVADWFSSLSEGPEARYYTPAIWQRARIIAEVLSVWLVSSQRSSVMWAALQNDMKSLLVDAGELRRLGIEVQATEQQTGADVIDWRARATTGT